jgi:hypothetical protein
MLQKREQARKCGSNEEGKKIVIKIAQQIYARVLMSSEFLILVLLLLNLFKYCTQTLSMAELISTRLFLSNTERKLEHVKMLKKNTKA